MQIGKMAELCVIVTRVCDEILVVFCKIRAVESAEDGVRAGNLSGESQNALDCIVRQFAAIEIFCAMKDDCSVL